ncbi:hypothetical protein DFJ74DRAFT_661698 [Hyaloraphidium curvatum]|nr:hypothetical protein DFJ74DRAFT_661698 [Hyaloraphidium curvatum]
MRIAAPAPTFRCAALLLAALAAASVLVLLAASSDPPPAGRRRIAFISTDCDSDASKFAAAKPWLLAPNRTFDVALVDFGNSSACAPMLGNGADTVFSRPDSFKFDALYSVLAAERSRARKSGLAPRFARYAHFLLCDADVDFLGRNLETLFDLADTLDLYLSQAALTQGSHVGHKALRQDPSVLARGGAGPRSGFVEIMCPLLSRRALETYLPDFEGQRTGWGLDVVWSWDVARQLRHGDWESGRGELMAVLDAAPMEHVRPMADGNAIYARTGGIGAAFDAMDRLVRNRTGMRRHQAFYFLDRMMERSRNVTLYADGRHRGGGRPGGT